VSRFDHCAITFVDFDRRVGAVAAKAALVGRRIPIFQLILV
jgi:hypothetical protein